MTILRLPSRRCKKSMHVQAELEREYFNRCMHIVGRTDWDKTHVWSVNPRNTLSFLQ